MVPNIKATNLTLTGSVTDYLTKRLEGLSKYIDKNDTTVICSIELSRDMHHTRGDVFRAEITLESAQGLFRAEARGETVNSAIDQMQSEISRELRRSKRKRLHLFRRGAQALKEMFRRGD